MHVVVRVSMHVLVRGMHVLVRGTYACVSAWYACVSACMHVLVRVCMC